MLEDAKKSWLTACLEDGIEIPEPNDVNKYRGQFKLRIHKTLHKELAEKSKTEGICMNQYWLYLSFNQENTPCTFEGSPVPIWESVEQM